MPELVLGGVKMLLGCRGVVAGDAYPIAVGEGIGCFDELALVE